ncbi:MAG TPA: ATP-binding protein [Jatrophihabitans sp.]|jgi:anti-sigma regulatory factor (Ser/Thr protein kinase)|uniref:ATP-binding protein n=1 Tax=Jatrophihabitans sp. TaxID=1932789 RepID=UPI002E0B0600|nr:ATP-binding protein [Jatrophihabitans sp.]
MSEKYPCAAGSPAAARRFARRNLTQMLGESAGADAAIADAEIIVSELLTNAINAWCDSTELRLSARDDLVRIEVHDDAGGEPRQRRPDHDDQHGRGLMIVSALAHEWGFERYGRGKRVWAELFVRAPRTA